MSENLRSPDERVLRLHLESGRFRSGVAAGRWRLVSLDWPQVTIAIKARDGVEYGFRFLCADYPRTAVTAQPWDCENNTRLAHDKWPTGPRAYSARLQSGLEGGHVPIPPVRSSIDRRARELEA